MPRPLISADRLKYFLDALGAGRPLDEACAAVGVSRTAIARIRKRDRVFGAEVDQILTRKLKVGPPPITEAAWDAFLAQLAEGSLTLRAVATLPGMPSVPSFQKRRANDPSFAARVAQVWSPLAERKSQAIDWEGALMRLAAGEHLTSFAGQNSYPTSGRWYLRRQRDAAFDGRVVDAMAAGERARGGGRLSVAKLDAIVRELSSGKSLSEVCSQPGMPTRVGVLKIRQRHEGFNARVLSVWSPTYQKRVYTDAHLDRVLDAVRDGRPLSRLREMGLPTYQHLGTLQRKNPAFRARMKAALSARGNVPLERSDLRQHLSQNDLWTAANAAVSRGLPSFIRDDVISEMIADAIQGDLDPADFKLAAREYVSDMMRGDGGGRQRSLDQDVYSDGGLTLHDVVGAW